MFPKKVRGQYDVFWCHIFHLKQIWLQQNLVLLTDVFKIKKIKQEKFEPTSKLK